MKELMGLINIEHEHDFLEELTYFRCGAATPFAGRYRLIDFTLSNMVNSGVDEVAVFTNHKYRSIMDHLSTGADWELARRHGGIFILPPDWNDPSDISKGDLRHFHNNRDYFHRSTAEHVVISGSQFLANMKYERAFERHLETDADVTCITVPVENVLPEHSPQLRINEDENGWVTGFSNDPENKNVFSNVYIIKKDLLLKLVDQCIAYHKDHFFMDGIKDNLPDLAIQSFHYRGYTMFINSVESFYRNNMSLLEPDHFKSLFFKNHYIRTKTSNEPPVKYKEDSSVSSSMLANGCVVEGEVQDSVLFRGVNVAKNATIKNSVIMQRCKVEEGAYLENVILDKDVHVSSGQKLIGSKEKPFIAAKRQRI